MQIQPRKTSRGHPLGRVRARPQTDAAAWQIAPQQVVAIRARGGALPLALARTR